MSKLKIHRKQTKFTATTKRCPRKITESHMASSLAPKKTKYIIIMKQKRKKKITSKSRDIQDLITRLLSTLVIFGSLWGSKLPQIVFRQLFVLFDHAH